MILLLALLLALPILGLIAVFAVPLIGVLAVVAAPAIVLLAVLAAPALAIAALAGAFSNVSISVPVLGTLEVLGVAVGIFGVIAALAYVANRLTSRTQVPARRMASEWRGSFHGKRIGKKQPGYQSRIPVLAL